MKILLKDSYINPNEKTLTAVSQFFEDRCNELEFSSSNIREIIFADDENYDKEIKRINPDDGFTNNQLHRGVCKTMYLNENKKNVIIINSQIWNAIVVTINNKDCQEYLKSSCMFWILHEIGHCITNSRNACNTLFPPIIKNTQMISKFNFDVILDEYNANKNIRKLMTRDYIYYALENVFFNDLKNLCDNLFTFHFEHFVSKIWLLYKRFFDIAVFLIDYNINEYKNILDKINFPFDYSIFINTINQFDKGEISEKALYDFLYDTFNALSKDYK
jgi:hypothetical protein